MVDLAFLLITFFMLTTSLAKLKAIDLDMPVDSDPILLSENRTMSICLGKDNSIQWYLGILEKPIISPRSDHYGTAGIRKSILEMSNRIKSKEGKELIVLLKPTDRASYRNLVDILDEMKIAGINQYMIADLNKQELESMAKAGLY